MMRAKFLIAGFCIFMVAGCRYVSWGKDIFNQGKKLETYRSMAKPYIRSTRIYDQLTTLGLFDAIWLSDPVRIAYTKAVASKKGFNQEQYKNMLEQQLEENKKYITFYVLAGYVSQDKILLTNPKSPWALHLHVGDQRIAPAFMEAVRTLEPEYVFFFDRHWSIFKMAYLVKFDRKKVSVTGAGSFDLVFRRIGHEATLTWRLDATGCALPECRLDEDVLAYDMPLNI